MTEAMAGDTAAVPKKNDLAGGVEADLVGRLVEQVRTAGVQRNFDLEEATAGGAGFDPDRRRSVPRRRCRRWCPWVSGVGSG